MRSERVALLWYHSENETFTFAAVYDKSDVDIRCQTVPD